MTICSRTKGYCFQEQYAIVFPIVFLLLYNLKIPKQGINMQIFFLNGLWRSLKNGHLPFKLHSSAPQGIGHIKIWGKLIITRVIVFLMTSYANYQLPQSFRCSRTNGKTPRPWFHSSSVSGILYRIHTKT